MKTGFVNITYLENLTKTSHWYLVRVSRVRKKYDKYASFQTMKEAFLYREQCYMELQTL